MKIKRTRATTLISDASHCHQTKAFGWALYITHTTQRANRQINIYRSGGGDYCPNSIDAEEFAIQQGITLLSNQGLIHNRHVIIVSDCTSALARIDRKVLKDHGARRISLRHIKGHQNKKFTEAHIQHKWCDRIARRIMQRYRKEYIGRIRNLLAGESQ